MKKIAIVFPGIGYHKDKPLLYYSIKLAKEAGYEVFCIDFSVIPWDKGDLKDPRKMKSLFEQAMEIARKSLAEVTIDAEDDVLFISKSIGTVTAACYASECGVNVKQIYFSPVPAFVAFLQKGGIAFCGDKDPLAEIKEIEHICTKAQIKMHKVAGGNHSLETGEVTTDLSNLKDMMAEVKAFLQD